MLHGFNICNNNIIIIVKQRKWKWSETWMYSVMDGSGDIVLICMLYLKATFELYK